MKDIYNGKFYPVFQPIFSTDNRRIVGYEVLGRWDNAHSVEQSMKYLEENNGINYFSRMFMKKLCMVLDHKSIEKEMFISINISPSHLASHLFLLDTFKIIRKCQDLGIHLWFELTEHTSYPKGEEFNLMILNINFCKSSGVKFAIDDFGTGAHHDEECIKIVKPSIVKLDKAFLRKKEISEWNGINNLASKYKFDLVAEGVEGLSDWEFLKEQKVNFAQGYYLGRPYQ
ncbi:EAL domain-containing protein [Vibrio orientalis]|nr:EAL domain-containing protein [Vibrio orientalis]